MDNANKLLSWHHKMIQANTRDTYKTNLTNGTHSILADEPISLGGTDLGLNPSELLEASLASCTSITLRMYINRKEWKVDAIDVQVNKVKIGKNDDTAFEKHIVIIGEIDDKQKDRLLLIASKCPVHKVLAQGSEIISTIELK